MQLKQQLEEQQLRNDLLKWQAAMEKQKASQPQLQTFTPGASFGYIDPRSGQLSNLQQVPDPYKSGMLGVQQELASVKEQSAKNLAEYQRGQVAAKTTPTEAALAKFAAGQPLTKGEQFIVDTWGRSQVGQAGVNKPPSGYRFTPQGDLEPITGGPADLKIQGSLNQDTALLEHTSSGLDRLAVSANELLNHPGLAGIMGKRGMIPNIPGSAAADAAAKLETLKSQIGFGVLQEMRNNSKTGGALGQVSDRENILLQNNLAALKESQSVEQMRNSLMQLLQYSEQAKDRLRNAFNMKHQTATGGQRPSLPANAQLKPTPTQQTGGWSIKPIP